MLFTIQELNAININICGMCLHFATLVPTTRTKRVQLGILCNQHEKAFDPGCRLFTPIFTCISCRYFQKDAWPLRGQPTTCSALGVEPSRSACFLFENKDRMCFECSKYKACQANNGTTHSGWGCLQFQSVSNLSKLDVSIANWRDKILNKILEFYTIEHGFINAVNIINQQLTKEGTEFDPTLFSLIEKLVFVKATEDLGKIFGTSPKVTRKALNLILRNKLLPNTNSK